MSHDYLWGPIYIHSIPILGTFICCQARQISQVNGSQVWKVSTFLSGSTLRLTGGPLGGC